MCRFCQNALASRRPPIAADVCHSKMPTRRGPVGSTTTFGASRDCRARATTWMHSPRSSPPVCGNRGADHGDGTVLLGGFLLSVSAETVPVISQTRPMSRQETANSSVLASQFGDAPRIGAVSPDVRGYWCPEHGRITVHQVALVRTPDEVAPVALCAVTVRRAMRGTASIGACGLPVELLFDREPE
jgi:hypothetical protein